MTKSCFIDIISVTYNSSEWIDNYIKSILESDFDLKKVSLHIVDNASTDDSVKKLETYAESIKAALHSFNIITSKKNHGFGKANNIAAKNANSNLLFFLNIDTEIEKDTLSRMAHHINRSASEIKAWELRQVPFEHPKFYNPVTGYTSWASGAALVIEKDVFTLVKGFDTLFFMYAEDVDISWKVRMHGYKIKYLPNCKINHYSYQSYNEVKPVQYIYSIVNNLILRLKFGSLGDIKNWVLQTGRVLKRKGPFEHSRQKILAALLRSMLKFIRAFFWHWKHRGLIRKTKPQNFPGFDYEKQREGAFIYSEKITNEPKVSFIVRTVSRPSVLNETLLSIQNQTYNNIEVIVVEDGPNASEALIKSKFKDLNVIYRSTGNRVGRTKAGNLALSLSTGDYINFLDDDDLLFADHTELLIQYFERFPEYKIIHNWGWEAKTETYSTDPYEYNLRSLNLVYAKKFNRLRLCMHNFLPIQTVMFSREVYVNMGGFDEEMDTLEDWDLWLRYSLKYDYYTVKKICSIYKVPYNIVESAERMEKFSRDYQQAREKQRKYLLLEDPISLTNQFKNIDL